MGKAHKAKKKSEAQPIEEREWKENKDNKLPEGTF